MGGPSRSEQGWETVNRLLVRQFTRASAGLLAGVALALWILSRDVRLLLGVLIGGGWMVANCAALAWAGGKALRPSRRHGLRPFIWLLLVLVGSLALMAWLVMRWHPSLAGVSVGLLPPLLLFLFQLRQLNFTIQSHAR